MVDDERVSVRVMVFNIEDGGTLVSLDQVVEAIRLADADVVALQEAMGNTARIATALGWAYASARSQVLSRHPVRDIDRGTVEVEIGPGRGIRLISVHLPADPYGPTLATAGAEASVVEDQERRIRLPAIEPVLAAHARRSASDPSVPTFLVGDFNAPSHLDRTEVAWPVSRAIEAAGFRDTWRDAHPDPVAEPGLTWPARRPPTGGWEPGPDEPENRIDMIYVAGPAATVASELAGEAGKPGVSVGLDPWPSDHRAVVSTCLVSLAPIDVDPSRVALANATLDRPTGPVIVQTSAPTYRIGEPIEIRWSGGPGYRWDWIAIFDAPAAELADRHLLWRHTGARSEGTVTLDAGAATVDQSSVGGRWPLPPGDYEAIYLLDDAPEAVGRVTFSIEAPQPGGPARSAAATSDRSATFREHRRD